MCNRYARVIVLMLVFAFLTGCGANSRQGNTAEDGTGKTNEELARAYKASIIELSDEKITVDGKDISLDSSNAVYAANDIVFYLEGQGFTYGEGTADDEHPQEEADKHTVVHITEPGNYVVSGKLSAGQIAVDLGKDAKKDLNAKVTLILNNMDITCSVAPGVIFYNVYECGDTEEEDAKRDINTVGAGANVIVADDSVNNVNGSYVARIYKSVELNEAGTEVIDSKKLHKYDAAFYSRRSMNINGEEKGTGVLNIHAENEGLDTELHLTINGGNININSGNDGINTNEDGVSVTTINGGNLNIVVNGSTGEGDGIDSNGWLVINGGTVTSAAYGKSMDSGIDSDLGIHINGGTVAATGNMLDEIAESKQNYAVFTAMESIKDGTTLAIKNEAGEVVCEYTAQNPFTYLIMSSEDLTEGTYTLWRDDIQMAVTEMSGRMPGMKGGGMKRSQNEPPQMPEDGMPQGEPPQMPEDGMPQGEPPQMPEGEMPQRPSGNKDVNIQLGEAQPEFTISEGGNMFIMTEAVK